MATSALSVRKSRVLADLVAGSVVREIILVAGYAGFIGIFAQISVPLGFTPVPITGQTFAVLIGAAALGWTRAGMGTLLYAFAGLAGVPWFAGGTGGIKIASSPSFGYIVGFFVCSVLVGMFAKAGWDRKAVGTAATMILGNLVIYAFGVVWLAVSIHVGLSKAIALGMNPFLAGDLVKLVLATALLPGAWYGLSKFAK